MRQLEIKAGSARKITGSPAVPSCSERGEVVESFRFVFLLVFSLYSDRSASLNIHRMEDASLYEPIRCYKVLNPSPRYISHYRRQLRCLPVLFTETDKAEKKMKRQMIYNDIASHKTTVVYLQFT
ncbi:hypothetical protein ALC53_01242 [Atta colombica]|uniref:Uncharacterized protein n=1 Tax=Atta colombica TaxID=520822 RepID=A0A195BU88_9HYME|nr:hypothetical protein ALC53_01242 [Atta colombica]